MRRKKQKQKYQQEITNHLNTAAYDTNGVINPTDKGQSQIEMRKIGERKKRQDRTHSIDSHEMHINEINLQHNKFLCGICMRVCVFVLFFG